MPISAISTLTPTTITITYEDYLRSSKGGCIEHILYIAGDKYLSIPLDANVRLPEPNKSKPYKEMVTTLAHTPNKFFENNLGISGICSRVELLTDKKVKITFPSGTGILNGGHTQAAIIDSLSDGLNISSAIVKVTFKEKTYTVERIAEMAACQNSSTPVTEYSKAEKMGYFSKIKSYMDINKEKHIVWYQGRIVPNNKGLLADDFIALINLFNIKLYASDYNTTTNIQPNISATSKSTAFTRWESTPNEYIHVYPLVNDIIDLWEHIQKTFHDKTYMTRLGVVKETNSSNNILIFSGETVDYRIPKQFLLPILASFRANIYYDEINRKIGWYEDNILLYNRSKKELFKRLTNTFRSTYKGEINHASKDSNLWEILYQTLSRNISKGAGCFKEYDI